MAMILTIEKIVPGGEGMARHEGRVVFVPGVLPGEEVDVEIAVSRKDFARARLLRVVKPSPDRVSPPCPLSGTCGGCDWQHIAPESQARFKIEMARDALLRIGGLDWPDLKIESGASAGYRNRIQLHTDRSRPGRVGFLERGGHGFVDVKECPVSHPAFAPLFAQGCDANAPPRFLAFATTALDGTFQVWREDENPGAEVKVSVLGRELVFPLRSFFQSNLALLPNLIAYAIEGLKGDTVFDLYSGVGLFGAMLRPKFRRIVCVESDPEALRYAQRNVGTDHAMFIAKPLEQVAPLKNGLLRQERVDAIIIDPPREGLASEVRNYLKERRVPKLVYVSCNPVTLARDLKELRGGPYELEELRLFDFFPHTSHVEAVAKLCLK